MRTLALALAVLGLGACARGGGPITIGLAGPFSQPRGAAMRQAAELAVREINARGGVGGRTLALAEKDDSGNEDVAVRVAQALQDDPAVVAVIGHLASGTTGAAVRVYGAGSHPVAMISPSASSPDLSGVNPYFFRVCPTDLAHGPALARFAFQQLGAKRAGIIYVNSDYGRGVRRTFSDEFQRLGGQVLEEDPYVPATPSLEPYLSRMKQRGGVDVLVLATERAGAELALREEAQIGVHWPALGGDALVGIEADGAPAEGLHISTAYLADRPGERNARFVATYTRDYPGQSPDHRGAGAYDIVYLLARALAEGGTTRAAVRDYLATVGTTRPGFDGVTGTIAFDARGDVPGKAVTLGVVRGGKLVTEAAR